MGRRYHVGHNVVGFEPADVACFRRWRPAARQLISTMRKYADHDDTQHFCQASRETTGYETQDECLTDDPPFAGHDFAATIEDNQLRQVSLLAADCDRSHEPLKT